MTLGDLDLRPCPSCGEPGPAAATWCEACGHELDARPKPTCVSCGETQVEADGYCHSCGHRQPGPRDRVELVDGPLVAVSDRGKRHHHNEDAVAFARLGDAVVLVVCDGVSSTPGSADISELAATVAAESLAGAVAAEQSDGAGAVPDTRLREAVERAGAAAEAASLDMEIDEGNPPSTTLVAAVARPLGEVVAVSIVWLGDSRAYWIDGAESQLLTVDHEVDGALTRWVGLDASHHQPQTTHHVFDRGGDIELLVCSDGMWRYFNPELGGPAHELIARLRSSGQSSLDLVTALVDHANDRGGHDNISVVRWAPDSPDASPGITVEAASDEPTVVDPPDTTTDVPPKDEQQ